MNTLIKTLILITGFSCMNTCLPMNYNQTRPSSNDFGIWEAQVITYGLTLSAFAYCAWRLTKNYNLHEKAQRRGLNIKKSKKSKYALRATTATTQNFKRR